MARPKLYDREEVLAKIKPLFWSKGFHGTSLNQIQKATGLARKSLYNEFESKDALFVATLEAYIQDEATTYADVLGRVPLGLSNVKAYFTAMRFDAHFEGCFLVNSLAERENLPAPAQRRLDRFFERVRGRFVENLVAAQQAGDLASGIDPEAIGTALAVMDQGLAVAGKSPAARHHLHRGALSLLDVITA